MFGNYRRKADQQPFVTLLGVGNQNITGLRNVAMLKVAVVST